MKASDVLAGKKFEALEIKKSSTEETAPESSPVGLTNGDENHESFRIRQQPIRAQRTSRTMANKATSRQGGLIISRINLFLQTKKSHFLNFFLNFRRPVRNEYHRLSESETHLEHPLAVLVGVGFDENLIEMSDESRSKAHYLFFPELGEEGQSALFITYLAGNEHSSVLTPLSDQLGYWITSNGGLEERLLKRDDAGPHKGFQPDSRVYPTPTQNTRMGLQMLILVTVTALSPAS